MKIGMFDSGLGGLTVLKEFVKKYPNNIYIYYGDTKNIPYGDKTKQELIKLIREIITFFEKEKVDMIIIACGTISSMCLNEIRQMTNILIYDVISPTIEYLQKTNQNKIGIFATNATINSHVFKTSLKNKKILEIATQEFVPMIENNKIDLNIIKKYCNQISSCDVLVLGCTHYPILEQKLKKYLPDVLIINMAIPLLNKVKLFNDSNLSREIVSNEIILYFTKKSDTLLQNINNVLDFPYKIIFL